MASRRARRQRQYVRSLEAALASRPSLPAPPALAPRPAFPIRKSIYSMGDVPVPPTSSALVEPIYPSQVPVLEPYRFAETFGAFQRGRLWNSYGVGVSFELLRLAVRRCTLLTAIHQVCLHDILQLSKNVKTPELLGWRVQHCETQDEGVDTETEEIQRRCARVTRHLATPHPIFEPNFRGFLAKVMDDYLTLNRVAIELIRNRRGEIVQFRTVDAATILPTFRVLQRFIGLQYAGQEMNPLAYDVAARVLERETGMPILESEYVCVMRGQLVGTFAPGELLIWEDMPVTDVRILFPPSYVEKALEGIVSWLYAFYLNRNYFSNGNPIEVILGLIGDFQDDSFVALEQQLTENFSGVKGAWRVPLVQLPIDGQLQVIRLKENHREMQFDEWMMTLASLACAIYRISTRRIELAGRGQQNAALFGHAQQEIIESSKEESFRIHSSFLADRLTHLVRLFDPDLEFVWSGLDTEDRDAEVKVEQVEVTTYRTPNELRRRHGDEPFPDDKKWGDIPLNALIYQAEGLSMGGGGAGGGPGAGRSPGQGQQPGSAGGREPEENPENTAFASMMAEDEGEG